MTADEDTRRLVLGLARGFVGTPYRHQGSRAGVGCDCLGLVRGVWRTLYGAEPEAPGSYSTDWAEAGAGERLRNAAARHLRAIPTEAAEPGDVVLFRWRHGAPAKHCGVLDEPAEGGPRLIHAYEGMAVVSSPLTPGWAARICAAFRFPSV